MIYDKLIVGSISIVCLEKLDWIRIFSVLKEPGFYQSVTVRIIRLKVCDEKMLIWIERIDHTRLNTRQSWLTFTFKFDQVQLSNVIVLHGKLEMRFEEFGVFQ